MNFNKKVYKIDKVYPITDEGYLLIHLNEKEWYPRSEKIATILCEEHEFTFKYTGFGNINGVLVLKLTPVGDIKTNILDFFKRPITDYGTLIFIEEQV